MMNSSHSSPSHFRFPRSRRFSHRPSQLDPVALAAELREREAESLQALTSILHHPRSLARPVPTWRPPSKLLPEVNGGELSAAVTRHRVGPRARARVRGFGEHREPAYLVSVRLTGRHGRADAAVAEAWIRALVPADLIDAVHEVTGDQPPTYCWLVDSRYRPLHSPGSLFAGAEKAA